MIDAISVVSASPYMTPITPVSPIRPQAAPAPEEISPANPQTVVDSYTPASENDVGKYQPYGLNEKDLRNYAATKMLGATQGMGEAAETGTATADEAEAQIAELEGKIDKKEQEAAAEKGGSVADSSRPQGKNGEPLNDEEMQLISELQSRDTEVRAHEAAHVAASQGYSSGSASFEYQTGPDGKRYAVGGEVSIDTSSESTPEATIRKMQVVRSAALAPAQPSTQDRRVAAAASQRENAARQELAQQQQEATKQAAQSGSNEKTGDAGENEASETESTPESTERQAGDTSGIAAA